MFPTFDKTIIKWGGTKYTKFYIIRKLVVRVVRRKTSKYFHKIERISVHSKNWYESKRVQDERIN